MDQQTIFVKMAMTAWDGYHKRTEALFNSLSDEEMQREVAPGKNTALYLYGHLIAVHDSMIPLLGFGDKLYPGHEEVFIKNPDKASKEKPSIETLRQHWNKVHFALKNYFDKMSPAQWFERHNSISEEDFILEPYRNKLSVLMSRTSHMAWHYGQVLLAK